MSDAARLRNGMVDRLRREGVLTDPHWERAFRDVPRHVFLPRFFEPAGDGFVAVDETDGGWLERIYSGDVLATQLDDDPERWTFARRAGPVPGTPTSSSSQPAIMAIMLEETRFSGSERTLEVGTGTGYNAALLCRRLGDHRVSTVDIDGSLVDAAVERLAMTGHKPDCVTADGALGLPGRAPFDRVLCTASVSALPPAWLEQTVPGGIIVTTLNRPLGGGLVRITAGNGATGDGRVLARDGRFMPLRAHRRNLPVFEPGAEGERRPTALRLAGPDEPRRRFEFYASLALPDVVAYQGDGELTLLHVDGSWARQRGRSVVQGGPRRLWDLAEAAYDEWRSLGEPARDRFGLTIDGDRQHFWLDTPDGPHWPLTAGP